MEFLRDVAARLDRGLDVTVGKGRRSECERSGGGEREFLQAHSIPS
jgi:hypothetical protein